MKLVILNHTVHDLGDCGRRVAIAVEPVAGETVEALVARTLGKMRSPAREKDHLEIRVCQEAPHVE